MENQTKPYIAENPIAPYIPEELVKDYQVKDYSRENRPITNEEATSLTKELISPKNFLNERKSPYLRKIWEDASYIEDILTPLRNLGFEYTLDLTGGSVRDFVLNNEEKIKDLDFMLKLERHKEGSIYTILNNFSKEELKAVDFEYTEDTNDYSVKKEEIDAKLVGLCINRKLKGVAVEVNENPFFKVFYKYESDHNPSGLEMETTKKDRLSAVIKIPESKTNYPVDIMLTEFVKPEFIEAFDFDLCKVSFSFVNPFYNKSFPKNYSHLISRFVADPNFWADYKNKKLTINVDEMADWQINRSISNHLPRLKEKYSDYEVQILGKHEHQLEIANKLMFAQTLGETLVEKDIEPTKKVRKNKI